MNKRYLSRIFFLADWRHVRRRNTIEISSIYLNVVLWILSFQEMINLWTFLCTGLDSPRAKTWFTLFARVSSRKLMPSEIKGTSIMMIMMLTIMVTMKTMITKVIILKSMMIKMIMVMIIVIAMITRQWMLKLLCIYIHKRFLDFSNRFTKFFEN